MRRSLCWLVLPVLALVALSCRSVPVAGECPETAQIRCLTAKKCVEDKKRACLRCQCEEAFQTQPWQADEKARGRADP